MHAEIFTVCDAATVQQGKLNILGSFDTLTFGSFPYRYPAFCIVAKVRFSIDEIGSHTVEVRWMDADGEIVDRYPVAECEVDFTPGRDIWQHVFHLSEKEFYAPTEYQLQIVVDATLLASIPLYIKGNKPEE
ncbi:MAG: hypothetical protein KDM91_09785 [Verrucomicrobiae bacterium]|nr:hypothetical protein [Verrucomicrobiae bacterium]MCP5538723.1 hypothetical protein [Akkermansiaceae bacterium]MCP5549478.1 hypothetical protein [Akkermansiaceae bacterium]